jgi:RHS repeat-associated protein
VTALSNSSGTIQTAYGYNAWGERTVGSDWGGAGSPLNNLNAIGYTGQFFDNETGLMPLGNGERYYNPSLGRFTQQDSFSGMLEETASLNRYGYAHGNPNKFRDPSGNYVESAWDIFSLSVGVASFAYNVYEGNYGAAGLDAVGIVADAAALAIPILPGGVGVAIKASRAAQATVKGLQTVDRAVNAGMAVANAYVEYTQGNYGWAALNAGFAALGAKGAYESANGVRAAWKSTPAVPDSLKTVQRQGDQIAEVIGEGNDEVADLVKPRPRFIADADGNVKDLHTGRGNLNTIEKQGRIEATSAQGVTYEGEIYRYEMSERIDTTWKTHKWNVAAEHRYTKPGVGGVYGSTSPSTAFAEISHYGAQEGRVLASKSVKVDRILDLTNEKVRQEFGVTLLDITSNSYTKTHQLGDKAKQLGYKGILAPSARAEKGVNLIYFEGY